MMTDSISSAANTALKEHTRAHEKIKLLMEKRGRLARDLAGVDEALKEILGPVRSQRRKRRQATRRSNGSQEITLPVRLAFILAAGKNVPMEVGDLAVAAKKDGWKTSSEKPNSVVQQGIGHDPDFVSKGRGKGWSLTGRAYATFRKAKREDYATG